MNFDRWTSQPIASAVHIRVTVGQPSMSTGVAYLCTFVSLPLERVLTPLANEWKVYEIQIFFLGSASHSIAFDKFDTFLAVKNLLVHHPYYKIRRLLTFLLFPFEMLRLAECCCSHCPRHGR